MLIKEGKQVKKESILYGVIGLLMGVIITVFATSFALNNNNKSMMNMMGMREHCADVVEQDMSMQRMVSSLKNKTGDDFDEAFIAQMVEHHQGAIDMANLAKQNAKHDEIKKLSEDIIATQTKEIVQMKTWQTQWGYQTENDAHSMHMMAH